MSSPNKPHDHDGLAKIHVERIAVFEAHAVANTVASGPLIGLLDELCIDVDAPAVGPRVIRTDGQRDETVAGSQVDRPRHRPRSTARVSIRSTLVRRDDTDRTHVYTSRLSEEQTQRQLVRDLLERAFGGSASKLVMQALNAKRATAEELGEIRKLIEARREERDDRD